MSSSKAEAATLPLPRQGPQRNMPCRHSWQIVCETAHKHKKKIQKFERWLRRQISEDPTIAEAPGGELQQSSF